MLVGCLEVVGAYGGLGDQIWVSLVSVLVVGSKNLKAMLRIALEEPNENFDNLVEETIPLWKNGTKYRFLYANPSRYMSFASDGLICISIIFPNHEDVD